LTKNKRTPKKSSESLEEGRLRDLAREATKHLDDVLSGGGIEGSSEREEGPGPGASEGKPSPEASLRSGRRRPRSPAQGAPGTAKALVAHVIPGMARVLGGLLAHSGFDVTVVDNPQKVESEVQRHRWDIAFVQGTAMPHPGKKIALVALSHCENQGTPVVLIARRGDPLVAEAGAGNAVGLLEWPFSGERLARLLSEVFPRESAPAPRSTAHRA
jgi:hypothetical protein